MTLDERIALYLAKCPPAVSGSRGHDQAFTVACALVNGFALDEADALRHFLTYNATCCPPWKERDLRHKLKHAAEKPHDKPRGYLLGDGANRPVGASQVAAKPVPVRLTAKERQFRTGRTTFFNPYAHTGRKTKMGSPYIAGVGAKPSEASGEGVSIESIPLDDFGAVRVPGCRMARPPEIVCSDATWQALNAHLLGGEPLVHLALSMFGPDCTLVSTETEEVNA